MSRIAQSFVDSARLWWKEGKLALALIGVFLIGAVIFSWLV